MVELLKLLLLFLVLIFLIKIKFPVGFSLFIGAVLLGALFGMNGVELAKNMWNGLRDWKTIHLIIVVSLITHLGAVLKYTENLADLTDSLSGLVKEVKYVLMFLPALVGLLPMPGGALLSAPMVQEVGTKYNLSAEMKTILNYWFRHIMEFIFPLYPGLILSAALLSVHLNQIILTLFPLMIAMTVVGMAYYQKRLNLENTTLENRLSFKTNLKNLLWALSPVLIIIFLAIFLNINLIIGLAISLIYVFIWKKVSWQVILSLAKKNFSLNIVWLIAGIMIFKEVLQASGAPNSIPLILSQWGVPSFVVLFFLPFIIGFLTGMTTAYIGISYPILMAYLVPAKVDFGAVMFSYWAGFLGLLISPVHLCLVLSKNYFKADFFQVYKLLIPPALILTILALFLTLFGYPWGIM